MVNSLAEPDPCFDFNSHCAVVGTVTMSCKLIVLFTRVHNPRASRKGRDCRWTMQVRLSGGNIKGYRLLGYIEQHCG